MRLLLLAYPWLELLSLIQLGIRTNALVALGYVLLMILLGSALLRFVGSSAIARLRAAQQSGQLQQHLFVDDLALAVSAVLLMVPGLVSDFFALIVLIGPLRRVVARGFGMATVISGGYQTGDESFQATRRDRPITLEGEFKEVDQSDEHP